MHRPIAPRWLARAPARFVLLGALLVAAPRLAIVHAQDTGGSFGGGDFGGDSEGSGSSDVGSSSGSDFGGGSSSGSDYAGNYGGSDYGYAGSTYGSSGGNTGGGPVGTSLFCLLIVGFILVGTYFVFRTPRLDREQVEAIRSARVGSMDVSSIRIALDHHARPILQQKLDALAKSGAAKSSAGRAQALHEICIELRRNEAAWLFAHVDNSPMIVPSQAQSTFARIASDARARFRVETVRAHEGEITTQADTVQRDRGEGPGLVVVTVVVAARHELVDVAQPDDARALHQLLAGLGAIQAADLVALEVIWSPSSENDRMTLDELGRLYPELRRIRDETLQTRIFCGYCGSPFWTGLSRCPHCGAPATDARAPATTPGGAA